MSLSKKVRDLIPAYFQKGAEVDRLAAELEEARARLNAALGERSKMSMDLAGELGLADANPSSSDKAEAVKIVQLGDKTYMVARLVQGGLYIKEIQIER